MRRFFCILIILFFLGSPSYAKNPPIPAAPSNENLNQEIVKIDNFYEELGRVPLPESPSRDDLEDTSFIIVKNPDNKKESHVTAVLKTEKNSIFVKKIEVKGNQLLSDDEIKSVISKYEGKILSKDEILQIVQEINNIYGKYNISTAKAYVPPQNGANNTLKIGIVEGRIGKINVVGNKYTRTSYIKSALSQKEGDIIFIPEIKDQLIKFNKNNDIKLRALINKGSQFGSSDVTLAVTEQRPIHANIMFDNSGVETIGNLREGISLQHDSLLGFRDRLNVGYYRTRSSNALISAYSFPVGYSGLRLGGQFSYDPLKITSGELEDLDIEGKTFNYSIFATKPLINKSRFLLASTLSLNHKRSTTYIAGQSLADLLDIPDTVVNSIGLGFVAVENDKRGQWVHSSNFDLGLNTWDAVDGFFKYTASLMRYQDLGHNIQLILKANTQFTGSDNLPSLEKFQIGGASSVRGYTEGYLIGNSGYLLGSELRFPLFILPKKIGSFALRDRVQCITFFDAGGAFQDSNLYNNIMGTGFGLRMKLSKFLFGRVDYGFGLLNRDIGVSSSKFYFGLESAPF